MTQVLPDDEAYFVQLLKGWGVQSSVQQVLKDRGFLTLSLLAHAVPAEANVESFLVALLGRPSGHPPDQPLFSAEASSLRRALKEAARMVGSGPGSANTGVPATPSAAQPGSGGRSKLSESDKAQLLAEFQRKYPSEYLRPETSPSLPFLNMLKESVDAERVGWIAWRFRTSEADESAWTEHRPARTDAQLVRSLLSDKDADELACVVPTSGPLEPIIRRFVELQCNGLALVSSMHLLPLRRMSEKFLTQALAVPADRYLRPPSLTEVMQADKVFWLGVLSLQSEHSWSLADSIAEMSTVRPDVMIALQPRPKAPAANTAQGSGGGGKKSKASSQQQPSSQPTKKAKQSTSSPNASKSSGGAASSPSKVTVKNWPANWAKQVQGKNVCIRYHTARCTQRSCRFSHNCPILDAQGVPCGAAHSAQAHHKAAH